MYYANLGYVDAAGRDQVGPPNPFSPEGSIEIAAGPAAGPVTARAWLQARSDAARAAQRTLPDACYTAAGTNVCLYGGAALAGLVLIYVLAKR